MQARSIALQQAELVSAWLGNTVDGTRQMMVALSASGRVQALDPACETVLKDLRHSMQTYSLVTVVRPDGTPACSDAAAPIPAAVLTQLAQPFLSSTAFSTGSYTRLPGLTSPMLTFALPLLDRAGAARGVVIAGLDLGLFGKLLASLRSSGDSRFIVADRDGTVLAAAPQQGDVVGRTITPEEHKALQAKATGANLFREPDGTQRIMAYVPPGLGPGGLLVCAQFSVADLVSGIDQAATRGYLLIVLGAALSILLALFVGHQYLRVPASVLLEAARQWGSGDLTARAVMPQTVATEFAGLGQAFNEMAELLQQQRAELQALNGALELRVAQRTRALLDSNNRLQVEIAERELTEGSLRQAQKLQAVGQLASGMAHDFNNLLTAILGSLELLGKRLTTGDIRQERLLDIATRAVDRGSRLTSQLLAFSRKQPLMAVSLDISSAISGMAALLESTLGASVRIETRVDDDLWPALLEANQFEASILNLALNARDAMPLGGRLSIMASNVTITPASPWSAAASGDYVCVSVSDSGTGMSSDVVDRAFEPFFTTKEPGKGSGLGLSQVHGMVRQSGGSITLESRPGDGTTVRMLFPRSLTSPLGFLSGPDQLLPALGRTEAVLLVDDDSQVRDVTAAMLADNGYTVLTADEGVGALAILQNDGNRIALVIADYAMPGMTGRELLSEVKQRWPEIAVLLATGYADYSELTADDLPIDQIVRKPFRANELLARIHMVIRRQADQRAMGGNARAT